MINPVRTQNQETFADAQAPAAFDSAETVMPDFEASLTMILVEDGIVDEKRLRHARRVQSKLTQKKPLLIVLQDAGVIDRSKLLPAMRKLPVKLKLGEMLVQLGYINVAALRSALSIQRDSQVSKRLSVILVENNFMSEDKLLDVLSVQLGVPKVEPDFSKMDKQILRNINPLWCREGQLIPVGMHNGSVVIAAHDPTNESTCACAEPVYGSKVLMAIAGASLSTRPSLPSKRR